MLSRLAACPALLYPDRQRLFRRAAVLLEARRCCAFRRARIFFSLLRWSTASIFLLAACSAATRLAGLRNSQCFVPAARGPASRWALPCPLPTFVCAASSAGLPLLHSTAQRVDRRFFCDQHNMAKKCARMANTYTVRIGSARGVDCRCFCCFAREKVFRPARWGPLLGLF